MDAPDDYDSPWKDAIEVMLPEFMAFYFPDAATHIDWQQPHRFLDQELQQLMPEAKSGKRVVDKLAEVMLVNGDSQWIYIHIEIQSQRDSAFAERMYCYHYRIFDRYQRPVASFAILADNHPHWRPAHYRSSVLGCHQRLDFPVAKLLDYAPQETDLLASDNPFALVTLAHLHTRRTRGQHRQRYRTKRRLLLLLAGRQWERRRIIQLFRVIDWLMTLPPALNQQLRRDVADKGGPTVKFLSVFERHAIDEAAKKAAQEAAARGRIEGESAILSRQLSRRFGPLPATIETRLASADQQQLERWADRVLDAASLEEVFG